MAGHIHSQELPARALVLCSILWLHFVSQPLSVLWTPGFSCFLFASSCRINWRSETESTREGLCYRWWKMHSSCSKNIWKRYLCSSAEYTWSQTDANPLLTEEIEQRGLNFHGLTASSNAGCACWGSQLWNWGFESGVRFFVALIITSFCGYRSKAEH